MTSSRAEPVAKPAKAAPSLAPAPEAGPHTAGPKRARDRRPPGDDTIHWLFGGADGGPGATNGQPIQRKPIDAGYGDIVAAAAASPGGGTPTDEQEADRAAAALVRGQRVAITATPSGAAPLMRRPHYSGTGDPLPTAERARFEGGLGIDLGHKAPNSHARMPGKQTLVEQAHAADVQPRANTAEAAESSAVHAAAAQGSATSSSPLPHGDVIQRAFGHHDISAVQAHTGSEAAASAHAMGAQAYATGNHVVLGAGTDLRTVAHEAAHVVQQRGGVQLKGGVGEVGDAYERHADAVADAVVQGKSAEGLLDRHTGVAVDVGAAPSATVQRDHDARPKPPDVKEAAWISPSTTLATTPAHVGSVFFHTKKHFVDDEDKAALTKLAKAYSPWAKRNLGKHGAELGLKGSVIGYADPRPSVEPDNQKLSEKRAFWTAHVLANALADATGLPVGYFDLAVRGAGVAARAPAEGPAVEDPLPHERRADIYLDGQAMNPDAGQPVPAATQNPDVVPPKLTGWDDNGWDRWEPQIRDGNKTTIGAIARQMMGVLANDPTGEILFYTPLASTVTKAGIEPFQRIQPPWWDSRTSQIDIGQGRGITARKGIIYKALLLKRDWKETMFYEDTEIRSAGGAYLTIIAEVKKDHPDLAKINEARKKVGYVLFMLDATGDLAEEVARMAAE